MLAKSGIRLRVNGDRVVVGGGGVVDVPVDNKKDESIDESPKESLPLIDHNKRLPRN